jgi:hypothetical protein
MSRLITQNIVYAIYHKAKTISEIARELGVPAAFVENEMDALLENDFVEKVAATKYLTNVFIQHSTLETSEFGYKTVGEYAEIVGKEYVPLLMDAVAEMMQKQGIIYSPKKDLNHLMWTAITHACRMHLGLNDVVMKHSIKRKDGSEYVPFVSMNWDYDIKNLSFNPVLYYTNGDMTATVYQEESDARKDISYWQLDTYYDSRDDDIYDFPCTDMKYLYEHIKGEISKTPELADKYKRLYDKGYLVQDGDAEYVNMIVVKMTEAEFWERLPKMSDDLQKLGIEMSEKVFEFSKALYPKHIHELYKAMCRSKVTGQALRAHLLEKLSSNGVLKPLWDTQEKTVNMMLFSDVLPLGS